MINLDEAKSSPRVLLTQERGRIKGRMDIELNDYPGTGANKNHEPGKPGSSD